MRGELLERLLLQGANRIDYTYEVRNGLRDAFVGDAVSGESVLKLIR
jgi:hypothetical protein